MKKITFNNNTMKYYLLIIFLLVFSNNTFCQAPFTTLSVEPNYVQEITKEHYKYVDIKKEKADFDKKNNTSNGSFEDEKKIKKIKKTDTKESDDVDFFKNNGLAMSIIDNGENRLSLTSQVIFYKINIFTPIEKISNHKYNIPIMLISKLSNNYDSIQSASSIDAIDYEAAPITLRIMPSFKLSKNKKYEEQLLGGFYLDARGLNIYNPTINEHETEIVGSGGIGFSFRGNGEAGMYNKIGELEKGKWLFSAMFQGTVGDKKTIQSLFKTEKDFITAIQSYFTFKISENNKFNLKVGYQHFFQKTIAGNKNNFSIAVAL